MSQIADHLTTLPKSAGEPLVARLERRLEGARARGARLATMELRLPGGAAARIGTGEPAFTISLADEAGVRALSRFDELTLAEAYMNGHLDFEGDMYEALRWREVLTDRRPLAYLWSTFLQPLLFGQERRDKRWIGSHYDVDPEFFVLWLDRKIRGYSHGFFEAEGESLETGMERKFRYAMDATGMKPGDRVLDIGGGWGSFLEFAGTQGVGVTSLTISAESEKWMTALKARLGLARCEVVREHFLEYRPAERFDAIVNLGVTEHLPDYRRTLANYARCLKPGRRVYLDAYSGERFRMPTFILKWVFQGNTSPLNLPKYLAEIARTPFEVVEVKLDRINYKLSCQKWAENLEKVRDVVVSRWGEFLYRRFRLYLWAAASSFERSTLSAHRMVLELPATG